MKDIRSGFAVDIHRLVPGDFLVLGGVTIPFPLKAEAHSDGDCLFHAVAEAVLGALAQGDLGAFFPPDDPEIEGINSSVIVKKAVGLAESKGYRIGNVDCSIVLEKPKLKDYIAEMRLNLADLLKVAIDRVSVKAGTNEGLDAVGKLEAVTCYASVLLIS